jgi:uncharacterized protein (TIGR03083 family)
MKRPETVELFLPLQRELVGLLRGLAAEDWARPTVARGWTVKDVAAHLLDTDLRRLSARRDAHSPAPPVGGGPDYAELVAFINRLNAVWVESMRRVSPRVLTDLLEWAGPQVAEVFASLAPDGEAPHSVAWAGEARSANWFDVGREYTERWLHQQQIRDAVGAPGLVARAWLYPVLDIFLRALPRTYGEVNRPAGSSIVFQIEGEAGGVWTLRRGRPAWELLAGASRDRDAQLRFSQDTAWRLLSKGMSREVARERIEVSGDQTLAEPFLGALAIMG